MSTKSEEAFKDVEHAGSDTEHAKRAVRELLMHYNVGDPIVTSACTTVEDARTRLKNAALVYAAAVLREQAGALK